MPIDNSTGLPEFEAEFAGPSDWARMYRDVGLQVVPCKTWQEDPKNWKRPVISEWKTLQEALIPEIAFLRWYGQDGQYRARANMGVITGRCSDNVFSLDLDDHKTPQAAAWWNGLLEEHYWGREPHTWQQLTGGGGRQLFFRGPKGWVAPTNRTPIGVDIRGQGGFAVIPPSMHESGREYAWAPDCAPWEVKIEDAPPWLIRAIERLVAEHGGASSSSGPTERTPSPGGDTDAFGARVDGREEYMRDMVWAAVVNWCRDCPIKPPEDEWPLRMLAAYNVYISHVKSRLPGVTEEGLEREGRGLSLFQEKWRRAMAQWEPKVQFAAKEAPPKQEEKMAEPAEPGQRDNEGRFPLVVSAGEFIRGFSPPEYLIDGIMQRGYLYSLTARTGAGKTAIAMYLAQCTARGKPVARKEVMPGSVLFLAGENPDDIRARFLVLADAVGFDPGAVPIHFIAGVVDIAKSLPAIRAAAEAISDLVLVIVDTAAAYFVGDDANSNTQQGSFARVLRELS
jgi:hypothetical protein